MQDRYPGYNQIAKLRITYLKKHQVKHIQKKNDMPPSAVYMRDKWPDHIEVAKLRMVCFFLHNKCQATIQLKLRTFKRSSILSSLSTYILDVIHTLIPTEESHDQDNNRMMRVGHIQKVNSV